MSRYRPPRRSSDPPEEDGASMQATDINDVLVKLRGVIDSHRGSPLVFFPAVYRATTARVQAGIQNGSFVDGARMERFVTAFANRYLAALDAVALGGERLRRGPGKSPSMLLLARTP